MKKQVNTSLSDKDMKKLDALRQAYQFETNAETIRVLIVEAYANLQRYKDLLDS